MTEDFIRLALLIGIGATLVMDIWAFLQKRLFGIPSLDYAMVGRWLGHLPRGQFVHSPIGKSAPVFGEALIGWTAHYAIGVLFAGILLMIMGTGWAAQPTLLPALTMGVATIIAPFFILQPGMGAGVAASRTPTPNVARFRSLVAHTSFGLGLYLAAFLMAWLKLA